MCRTSNELHGTDTEDDYLWLAECDSLNKMHKRDSGEEGGITKNDIRILFC